MDQSISHPTKAEFDWLQVSGRADAARPTPLCGFAGHDRFLPGTLSPSWSRSDQPRRCGPRRCLEMFLVVAPRRKVLLVSGGQRAGLPPSLLPRKVSPDDKAHPA